MFQIENDERKFWSASSWNHTHTPDILGIPSHSEKSKDSEHFKNYLDILHAIRKEAKDTNDVLHILCIDNDLPAHGGGEERQNPRAAEKKQKEPLAAVELDKVQEVAELDKLPRLKGEDLSTVRRLQDFLDDHLIDTLVVKGADEVKPAGMALVARLEKIQQEKELGVYGPATQEGLTLYANWLKKTIPEEIAFNKTLELPVQPGLGLVLPKDATGKAQHPDAYRTLSYAEELKRGVELHTEKIPTNEQVDDLETTRKALAETYKSREKSMNQAKDRLIHKAIEDNDLPEGWQYKTGMNPDIWRRNAISMIDLVIKVRNYVDVMENLQKANSDFPYELPPGVTLTKKPDGSGTVVSFKDLPADLRLEHPGLEPKAERLRQWMEKHHDVLEKMAVDIARARDNPDAVIQWGDREVHGCKALLDKDKNFIRLVDAKKFNGKLNPGETLADLNLVENRFDIENKEGKIIVTQSVQAQEVPFWGYRNLYWENIGNKMRIEKKEYAPNDFVLINSGGNLEAIRAKDLQNYKSMQALLHHGETVLGTALDVSMCVSGTIEIGAAWKAARSADIALRLTAPQLIKQGGAAVLKTAAGASGILNSAGGRDSELGATINTARGIYFLGDVGVGAGRQVFGLVRAAKAAEAAEAVQAPAAALASGAKIDKALKDMSWVFRGGHAGAELGFRVLEVPLAIQIGADLKEKLERIQHLGERDPLSDAADQWADGRGKQLPKKDAFNPQNPHSFKTTERELTSYSAKLQTGCSEATRSEIKDIFDETRKLLGPEATEAERRQFKEKLFGGVAFNAKTIEELERSLGAFPIVTKACGHAKTIEELDAFGYGSFSQYAPDAKTIEELRHRLGGVPVDEDYLDALRDPIKVQTNDHQTINRRLHQQIAKEQIDKIDPNVQVARAIALLYLSRDKDGLLPKEIATLSTKVPRYELTDKSVKEHEVKQTLKTEDVLAMLQHDLESPNGKRHLVTGEVLMQTGAISGQQYAGVLQDVLANKKSSHEDKRNALTWFSSIIDTLHLKEAQEAKLPREERERIEASHFGLSAADLLATLNNVARTDADADIRATAAMLSYGTQFKESNRHSQILSSVTEKWLQIDLAKEEKVKAGVFSDWAIKQLQGELNKPIPLMVPGDNRSIKEADQARENKLSAALHMEFLTNLNDQAGQLKITKALAESFSPTDKELSLRVLQHLLPDRINKLTENDPTLANHLRALAVSFCKTPLAKEPSLSEQQAAQMVQLLKCMEPLLNQGPQQLKIELAQQLEQALDASFSNRKNGRFAEYNPDIRIAAIKTLGELGSMSSLNVIRARLTSESSIKIDDKTVLPADEQDAAVRQAAVRALKLLNDPKLHNLILDLIDKESDQSVASTLRDIEFTQKRIARDSREWNEIKNETKAKLVSPESMPKNFGDQQALDLLNSKYPLLHNKTFDAEREQAAKDANSWYNETMPWVLGGRFDGDISSRRLDARHAKQQERNKQWSDLCQTALKGDEEGNRAKYLLNYIMTGKGSPCASDFSNSKNESISVPNTIYDWEEKAARALAQCCKNGSGGRDLAKYFVAHGLTMESHLNARATLELLEGWRELGKGNIDAQEVPAFLARSTALALEIEIQRGDNQNEKVQMQYIHDLLKYQDRSILPVLEAIGERGKFQKTRDYAKEALSDLRDSVDFVWKNTSVDQLQKPSDRATAIKLALNDNKNAEQTVQAICSAYKGYAMQNERDPGLPFLRLAMNDNNTMVRIAACRVIAESKLDHNGPDVLSAMLALNVITTTGSENKYKQEAATILGNLMGKERKVEFSAADGKTYVLLNTPAGISLLEKVNGLPTRQTLPGGKVLQWQRDASGDLTQFETPQLGVCTRQPDGSFKNAAGKIINKATLWKSDQSFSFEDNDTCYRFTAEGVLEQATKQVPVPQNDGVQLHNDKPVRVVYNPGESRTVGWDGDKIVSMTYRRPDNPFPILVNRQKDNRGNYTDEYLITLHVFDRNTEMWEEQSHRHAGQLWVTKGGSYSWVGRDGYHESQDIEGSLKTWRE